MVQGDVDITGGEAHLWVRTLDANNGYKIRFKEESPDLFRTRLYKIVEGKATSLAFGSFDSDLSALVKVKIYNDSGSQRFKVRVSGTLEVNVTDSTFLWSGVAFGGDDALFDNCKIGYDTPRDQDGSAETDDDIDDAGFLTASDQKVSSECLPTRKASAAPTVRQRSANVKSTKRPFLTDKNAGGKIRNAFFGRERLLDTQEVRGSSPLSPNRRKSLKEQ